MYDKHWITADDLKRALDLPVEVNRATYQDRRAPYFIDYLARQLETLYSPDDLSSLGLSIYTTLDTRIQKAAERALEMGLDRLERKMPALRREAPEDQLQGAVVVLQPKTGYILAMVGGRDYAVSQYNRVVQSRRQPGSAFKPFVYLAALDQFTPATRLSNAARTYTIDGKAWQPANFSEDVAPDVSLRTALAKSHNRATVDLAMRIGLDKVVALTERLQFSTPFEAYPSLALGAFEVIPLELARAFCIFGADGMLPYPLSLIDVLDENHRLLKRTQMSAEQLISPAEAFIINDLLKSVVTEGTARAIADIGNSAPIAGKTGTTNDFRDAWFVGYTPAILALVWVGFDDGQSIHSTGAAAALPIWSELMQSLPEYLATDDFKMPSGVTIRNVCSESGLLADGRTCPEPIREYFLEGKVPVDPCPLHPPKNPLIRIVDGIKKLFEKK
jgi:penicillin-binding protein 1B